jgi:hypothetical protein
LQLAHGGCDGRGSEALIFSLRGVQTALAVLAFDSAANGDGLVGAEFPAVQLEEAFSQVLSAGCGEAAFPGDVFALGSGELVVRGWLWRGACEVLGGSLVAGAVGEEVSGWGEGPFDGFVTGCVSLRWERDLDESGGLGSDFGTGRGGGKCPCVQTWCLT